MISGVKSAALRFLKIRPRSVYELIQKLREKSFAEEDINEVIKVLITAKLLDDRVFADAWIRYRLARPFGFLRIVRELKEKGISDDIIEQTVNVAKEEYVQTDVVMDVARRKLSCMSHVPPEKQKKRLFDFLMRCGFNTPDVMKVIKNLGIDDVEHQ